MKITKLLNQFGLYKPLLKIVDRITDRKKRKLLEKYGLEALIQADKAFKSQGCKVFLHFGTLLGAIREKDFIAHDNDLDLGYFYDEQPENLIDTLEKFGFVFDRYFYFKEDNRITEYTFSYKGLNVDFFAVFKQGDDMYAYAARRHETKIWQDANSSDGFPCVSWWFPSSGLTEADFLGHQFFIPQKASQWMSDVYGTSFITLQKKWSEFNQPTRKKTETKRIYRKYV